MNWDDVDALCRVVEHGGTLYRFAMTTLHEGPADPENGKRQEPDASFTGSQYHRQLGSRELWLVLSRYRDKEGYWSNGCRIYDFEATAALPLEELTALMGGAKAELNLATAEQALARLTGPAALADAQLAVVTKQAALDDALDALTGLNQPNVDYYATTLDDAQRAYDTAVANAQLITTGSRSQEQAVANAEYAVELAQGKLNDAIRWYGEGSEKAVAAQATLALAQADLEAARLALQVATSNQEKTVSTAAAALETALAARDWASAPQKLQPRCQYSGTALPLAKNAKVTALSRHDHGRKLRMDVVRACFASGAMLSVLSPAATSVRKRV